MRLVAGDQREEGAGDAPVSCSRSGPVEVGDEQVVGSSSSHLALHGRDEQRFLVAEMAVDGELGHAGLGRDLVHADAVEAVLR